MGAETGTPCDERHGIGVLNHRLLHVVDIATYGGPFDLNLHVVWFAERDSMVLGDQRLPPEIVLAQRSRRGTDDENIALQEIGAQDGIVVGTASRGVSSSEEQACIRGARGVVDVATLRRNLFPICFIILYSYFTLKLCCKVSFYL